MQNWRFIEEHNVSTHYGLGVDEYLMDHFSKDKNQVALRLYTYKNYSALSGRFQDLNAEIDIAKCNELGFGYSRRLTGGGAIIMGEGQLGICLTAPSKSFDWDHLRELYTLFSQPIILALEELGIQAEFKSKNDLEVGTKKIAGLGVYLSPEGNIQFHASLLMDLDIEAMLSVLKIPIQKFSDKKKVESVSQRLTTISKEIGKKVDLKEIVELISKNYTEYFKTELINDPLTVEEKSAVDNIERYSSESWILQNSPQADMTGMSLKKTPDGLLRTYIGLKGNTIKSVLITGDFFDQSEVLNQIEASLKWGPLEQDKIQGIVQKCFDEYSSTQLKMTPEDVSAAIWRAGQRAMIGENYTYNGSCYYPKSQSEQKVEVA